MYFCKSSDRSALINLSNFVAKSKVPGPLLLIEWGTVLAGLAISQGANALAFIIIANKVPPMEYGQYLATYGLVSLTVVLPSAGLDTFLLSRSSNDPSYIYLVWKRSLHLRLGLLAVWAVVLRIIATYLPPTTYPPALIGFVAIGLAIDVLTQTSYSAMRNLNRHREVSFLQILTAITTIIVASVWPSGSGQVLGFSIARSLISGTFAFFVLLRMRQLQTSCVSINLELFSNLFKKLFPFFLADLAVAVYLKADLTIVALVEGAHGASVYGPALNILGMLFLIPNALYLLILPALAKRSASDQNAFSKTGRLQLGLQFLVGVVMTITLFLLSPMLIFLLLGPAYINSVLILRILSPLMLLKALNFGLAAILTSDNLQWWRTTAQIVSALFNVIANLMVIGPLGIPGVALVYLLSEALLFCGYAWPVCTRFFKCI